MNVSQRTGDLASGVVTLIIGIWYLGIALRDLVFWTPGNQPGGGFFPMLLGSALLVLSSILISKGFRTPRDSGGARTVVDRQALKRPLLVLLSLAAWVILFPILGYIISTLLLTGGLIWAFGSGSTFFRVGMAIGVSVVAVVGFYVVFGVIFSVELPAWPSFLY